MPTAQTFADTLFAPGRALAAAGDRRSFVPPIAAATLASLIFAFVLAPRVNYERAVDEQAAEELAKNPQAATQPMSPHDREVALAQAQKLGGVLAYGAALLWPGLRALSVALCMLVAFRVAGAKPPFPSTLAVASWGLLPLAVKDLLSLPALLRLSEVTGQDAGRVLPSSLAVLLPSGAQGPLAGLAQAFDLFSIWSLALVALGAAHVASVSLRRASAVVLVLWGAYALLFHVARPGLMHGGPG